MATRQLIAFERRRLLAHAMHTHDLESGPEPDDGEFDDAVTTEIVRLAPELVTERLPPRAARGTYAPQIDELRAQTAAYRAQAIALNAKLAMHEHTREELRVVRVQLAESSARIEHAVDDIDAFTELDEQLGVLRPMDGH